MLHRIVVNVGDAQISQDSQEVLVTYGLGSCIGICMYDPIACLGAMVHSQLPDSRISQAKAKSNPLMFVDTGLKMVIDRMESMGANKRRRRTVIAGGAAMKMLSENSDIGRKNYQSVRKLLWKANMFVDADDVGGSSARTMYLGIADGVVTIRCIGAEKKLWQIPLSVRGGQKQLSGQGGYSWDAAY